MKDIIKSLVSELNDASSKYYNGIESGMSDAEWDNKFNLLKKYESESMIVFANSPTQRVGFKVLSKIPTKVLTHPMLSLKKCHTVEEIETFSNNQPMVASIKLDGLSVSLEYQDGELISATTRGNGEEGSDITEHVKYFKNVPLHINRNGRYIVDGEAIVTYNDFNEINSKLDEEDRYSHPRNFASGTLNQLDMSIVKSRNIRFICWNVIEGDDSNSLYQRLCNATEYFDVVPMTKINDNNLIESTINGRMEYSKAHGLPCDGIVFAMDDIKYGKSLGRVSHHFNNGIAWKPARELYKTRLKDIEWSMGKVGDLTPVVIFDSVNINGASVSRASLHNLSILKSLGLKRFGQTMYVFLANMIIPNVDHTDDDCHDGLLIEIPSTCPICGGMAIVEKNNDTEVLKCINPNCKGKLLGKLTHFVSKNAINIDGLSEATIEKFIELGWLNNFKDIYNLKDYKNKMYSLDGFGEKSVNKLLGNIEKSRNTELSRFLAALSIPLIGKTASKEISKMCDGSYDKFITLINLNVNEFSKIDGFGNTMLESLKTWWKENNEDICLLSKEFNFIENNVVSVNSSNSLSGKTFCITGSFEHYKNRDEIKELIESIGGKVTGSVTSKTTYLLNNDLNSASSKNKKAKELGIPIISELEFQKLLE